MVENSVASPAASGATCSVNHLSAPLQNSCFSVKVTHRSSAPSGACERASSSAGLPVYQFFVLTESSSGWGGSVTSSSSKRLQGTSNVPLKAQAGSLHLPLILDNMLAKNLPQSSAYHPESLTDPELGVNHSLCLLPGSCCLNLFSPAFFGPSGCCNSFSCRCFFTGLNFWETHLLTRLERSD